MKCRKFCDHETNNGDTDMAKKTIIVRSNKSGLADFICGWLSIRKDGNMFVIELNEEQYNAAWKVRHTAWLKGGK